MHAQTDAESGKPIEHTLSCPADLDKMGSVPEAAEEGADSSSSLQNDPTAEQMAEEPSNGVQTAPTWIVGAPKVQNARLRVLPGTCKCRSTHKS